MRMRRRTQERKKDDKKRKLEKIKVRKKIRRALTGGGRVGRTEGGR